MTATDTQTAKGPDAKAKPTLLCSDDAVRAAAAAVLASGEFKAGANETVLLHSPAGLAAKRLLLVGLGKQAKVTIHSVRNAAGTAVRYTKPRGIRELTFALPEASSESSVSLPPGPCVRAAVEGALVGDFDPDTYRSDRKDVRRAVVYSLPHRGILTRMAWKAHSTRGGYRREPEFRTVAGERAGQ